MIDGDAHYWMNEEHMWYRIYEANDNRIGQMIFLCECSNVTVTDVTLHHAPYWHLFLHGCTDVRIDGLYIRGQIMQYTNDGIDIDCCQRVTVSNCNIRVGDDAITLRGHDAPLTASKPCENVTITNCVLTSNGGYAIRVGVGEGLIRNCVLSNLAIDESNFGIGIVCRYSSKPVGGTRVENLRFNNIIIRARRAFQIRTSNLDTDPEFTKETKSISFNHLYDIVSPF